MDEQRSRPEDERPVDPEYRVFPKSWGAEYIAAGEVRFRLWASGIETLNLRLIDEEVPMTAMGDGWWELLATNVAPGTPYAFVLPDGRDRKSVV